MSAKTVLRAAKASRKKALSPSSCGRLTTASQPISQPVSQPISQPVNKNSQLRWINTAGISIHTGRLKQWYHLMSQFHTWSKPSYILCFTTFIFLLLYHFGCINAYYIQFSHCFFFFLKSNLSSNNVFVTSWVYYRQTAKTINMIYYIFSPPSNHHYSLKSYTPCYQAFSLSVCGPGLDEFLSFLLFFD